GALEKGGGLPTHGNARGPADGVGSTGPSAARALLLLLFGRLLLRQRVTSPRREDENRLSVRHASRGGKNLSRLKVHIWGSRRISCPRYGVLRKLTSPRPRCSVGARSVHSPSPITSRS